MDTLKIYKTIVKFLNREATHKELEELDVWLKDDKNIPVFNRFVRTEYIVARSMAENNLQKAKDAVNQKIKSIERKQRMNRYKKMAVAASILLIFGVTVFKLTDVKNDGEITVTETSNRIETGSNKAILTLGNGDQVVLGKGKKYQTDNITSNGEAIVYESGNQKNNYGKPDFNYLTIPRGGQFHIQLPDGTEVWLNSDSKLKYPTQFYEGMPREVELVYGEAFLEVSPSSEHNGAVFNIKTRKQEVSVLGTKFNVRAYTNDSLIATTLVEGKVLVKKGEGQKVLSPNQQSRIKDSSDEIHVMEVDVSQEISWINGLFTFNEESLEEMMKVLSRWYDVEVIFESSERKNFIFTGVLERTKSFIDILEIIEATSEGEVEFEINGKTVIVK